MPAFHKNLNSVLLLSTLLSVDQTKNVETDRLQHIIIVTNAPIQYDVLLYSDNLFAVLRRLFLNNHLYYTHTAMYINCRNWEHIK